MNFTIYADNNLIYNRAIVDEYGRPEYPVINPVLSETTDGFCSLTYNCKKGTPAWSKSIELIPRIKVYEDGQLYWTGRILKSTPSIHTEKSIYVEDFLSVLCDGIYRPFDFYGSVSDLLEQVVFENNSQVGANQQIYSIVCDVDVGNIVRSSEGYNTCWSIIQDKLLKPLGGYMWIEYDSQERAILHYSMSARNAATQRIRFGENLKSYKVEYNFDGFYTACVPLGAKDNQTKEYVTIASVNDGKDYLIDETNAAIYGIIYAPTSLTTWDDVHEPSILLARGQAWRQNQASRLIQKIDLSAHDLSGLNVNLAAIHWLDEIYVESAEINSSFILKRVSRKLDDPLNLTISMGDSRSSVTGSAVSNQNDTADRIEYIESNYTTEDDVSDIVQPELDALREETLTQMTAIRQEANEIVLAALEEYRAESATSLDELYQRISSELQILADKVDFNFNYQSETISEIDGRYNAEINNILSFIRLLPTTATQEGGIVIGESTSEIKLKLENDVLYFFTGDETTVSTQNAIAYFAAGQLVVNEAVLRVASIGFQGAMMHFSVVGSGSLQCLFLSPRRI